MTDQCIRCGSPKAAGGCQCHTAFIKAGDFVAEECKKSFEKLVNDEMKKYEAVMDEALETLLITGEVCLKFDDEREKLEIVNRFKGCGCGK